MSVPDDDAGLPDMKALYKTNPLIPDPSKLQKRVIPAEDIAGWLLPFEIVFGMVYWNQYGVWLLLAFVATVIGGWIIPMQQRYALLARSEFVVEQTQIGHLGWEEQWEYIRFEPVLEPAFKKDAEGKLIFADDSEPIIDELDLEEWASIMELEDRIIKNDDGTVSSIHTLEPKYIANLFQKMYDMHRAKDNSFEYDKVGWMTKGLQWFGGFMLRNVKTYLPKLGSVLKTGLKRTGSGLKSAGGTSKKHGRGFSKWFGANKYRFAAAIVLGAVIILFSQWILYGLKYLMYILGWVI